MAQKVLTANSFASITYNAANRDTRWQILDVLAVTDDTTGAGMITNLFQSNGSAGVNTLDFQPAVGKNSVVVAVRIPTVMLMHRLTFLKKNATMLGDFFNGGTPFVKFDIEISGRSDKKYSEVVDWVKIADENGVFTDDNTEATNPFLPWTDGAANADARHTRTFQTSTSWIKIRFKGLTNGSANELILDRIRIYQYLNDTPDASEDDPDAQFVFPASDTKWLPSQTVYFTGRIVEPDADQLHIRCDIFKENNSNLVFNDPETGGQDILMYRIDSNALNIDGSSNENYTKSFFKIPVSTFGFNNTIHFNGYASSFAGSVLVVPQKKYGAARLTATVDMTTIRFYNGTVLVGQRTGIPNQAVNGVLGTVVNLTANNLSFNKMDIVQGTNAVEEVKVYIINSNVVDTTTDRTLAAGSWTSTENPKPADSKIEFCWPKSDNYSDGYVEGDSGDIGYIQDNFNPDRNGIGVGQTNDGDWSLMPMYSGIMLGAQNSLAGSGPRGDSPLDTTDVLVGVNPVLDAYLTASTPGKFAVKPSADRIAYVRVAMPDPFKDGERFYARFSVWDGQTKEP